MPEDVKEILSLMESPTPEEVALIRKAFEFAQKAHAGHLRHSGEPYFTHLFETAKILAELGMGGVTIAAGFLHDAVEDQDVSIGEIEKEFGKEAAFIVDGVTKLGSIKYRGTDRHNESLRKLFVATSEDIRVLIVKLADRLHNMRTLHHVPKEKQKRIATETLEIYAPIAYRLGIRKLNRELEDLAFPYVFPKEYEAMRKVLKEKHHDQEEALEKFVRSLKKALAKEGLTKIKTDYRVKGLYSLYKKLLRKDKDIDQIHDISAVRILVEKEEECYHILGIIHANWRPLPGRIKDYIALPKPNGYRAIHTTVFTGEGDVVEIQIKTFDMHKYSEYGIASHIAYKGGNAEDQETIAWVNSLLPKHPTEKKISHTKDIPSWIKELVAYQESTSGHEAFKKGLENDFFSHRIFVFSPKGDVVDLPVESTPVDFAYSIHSDIGDHMVGAKVNGKLVSLDTKLRNGDIVEVMNKSSAQPNKKWIEFARTSMARRHIRTTLSKLNKSKR